MIKLELGGVAATGDSGLPIFCFGTKYINALKNQKIDITLFPGLLSGIQNFNSEISGFDSDNLHGDVKYHDTHCYSFFVERAMVNPLKYEIIKSDEYKNQIELIINGLAEQTLNTSTIVYLENDGDVEAALKSRTEQNRKTIKEKLEKKITWLQKLPVRLNSRMYIYTDYKYKNDKKVDPLLFNNVTKELNTLSDLILEQINQKYLIGHIEFDKQNCFITDMLIIDGVKQKFAKNSLWNISDFEKNEIILSSSISDKVDEYIRNYEVIKKIFGRLPLRVTCNQKEYLNTLKNLEESLLIDEVKNFEKDVYDLTNLEKKLMYSENDSSNISMSEITEMVNKIRNTSQSEKSSIDIPNFELAIIKSFLMLGGKDNFDYLDKTSSLIKKFRGDNIINYVIKNAFNELMQNGESFALMVTYKKDISKLFLDIYKDRIRNFLDSLGKYSFANICLEGIRNITIKDDYQSQCLKLLLENFLNIYSPEYVNGVHIKKRIIKDDIVRPNVKAFEKSAIQYLVNIVKKLDVYDSLVKYVNGRPDLAVYKDAFSEILSSEILDKDELIDKLVNENPVPDWLDFIKNKIEETKKSIGDTNDEIIELITGLSKGSKSLRQNMLEDLSNLNDIMKGASPNADNGKKTESKRKRKKNNEDTDIELNLFDLVRMIYNKETTLSSGKNIIQTIFDEAEKSLVKNNIGFDILSQNPDSIIYKPTVLKEKYKKVEEAINYYTSSDKLNLLNAISKMIPLSKKYVEKEANNSKLEFLEMINNELSKEHENFEARSINEFLPFIENLDKYASIVQELFPKEKKLEAVIEFLRGANEKIKAKYLEDGAKK
ncbi:Uncharacterised protein [Candidatus Tiddalikarchaeum anstoanum]|nr:Uncharacterised protein [Candidatus Tiddalikarchaeum anstoanum]